MSSKIKVICDTLKLANSIDESKVSGFLNTLKTKDKIVFLHQCLINGFPMRGVYCDNANLIIDNKIPVKAMLSLFDDYIMDCDTSIVVSLIHKVLVKDNKFISSKKSKKLLEALDGSNLDWLFTHLIENNIYISPKILIENSYYIFIEDYIKYKYFNKNTLFKILVADSGNLTKNGLKSLVNDGYLTEVQYNKIKVLQELK